MFGVIGATALLVFSAIGVARSHQDDVGLCSQVFLMHQYCTRDGSAVPSSPSDLRHPRVGKSGPRGPPGPPGRPAVVDYSKVNEIIDERLADLDQAIAKMSQLQDLMTWFKAANGYYYKVFRTRLSYLSARANCREEGGVLASAGPRNPDVRRELVTFMKSSGSTSLWIGANDLEREGTWVWEDGVTSNAIDWSTSPRQPDDSGNEDCAHYFAGYGWKVNDGNCDRTMNFLCEKTYRGG